MLFKKSVLIFLFISFSSHIIAQLAGTILVGNVLDNSTAQTIEFANIQLLKLPDSTTIKSAVTDKKGKFMLENLEPGSYLLRCSFIGFANTDIPVTINKQPRLNLGKIEIKQVTTNLQEVTISRNKSVLNTR